VNKLLAFVHKKASGLLKVDVTFLQIDVLYNYGSELTTT